MRGKNRIINYVQTDKFCVYGLLCPLTLSVKYIGCTSYLYVREAGHLNISQSINEYTTNKEVWIISLKAQGLKPIPVILKEFKEKKEARQYEAEMIKKHAAILLNQELKNKRNTRY